jgi:hypothetical protein
LNQFLQLPLVSIGIKRNLNHLLIEGGEHNPVGNGNGFDPFGTVSDKILFAGQNGIDKLGCDNLMSIGGWFPAIRRW